MAGEGRGDGGHQAGLCGLLCNEGLEGGGAGAGEHLLLPGCPHMHWE